MPLTYDKETEGGGRISVWRMDETIEELQKFVSEADSNGIFSQFKHPLRQKQKLSIRHLANLILGEYPLEFGYTSEGRPYPTNKGGYVSIAHSNRYAALFWHPESACGVDIEQPGERILRTAERFLHPEESEWISPDNTIRDLTLVWGVKECLFKSIGQKGVIFRKDLRVESPERINITEGKGKAIATCAKNTSKVSYQYIYLEDFLLVFTIAYS